MQKPRGSWVKNALASAGDKFAQVMTPSPWFPGERISILRVEVEGYSAETYQDGCGCEAETEPNAIGHWVFWEWCDAY